MPKMQYQVVKFNNSNTDSDEHKAREALVTDPSEAPSASAMVAFGTDVRGCVAYFLK